MSGVSLSDSEESKKSKILSRVLCPSSQLIDKSESKAIIINFYSGGVSEKSDKVSQTEQASASDFEEKDKKASTPTVKKKGATSSVSENCLKKEENNESEEYFRKSKATMSEERSGESRRGSDGKSVKGVAPPPRAESDLERRRLEAELKAAEEIGRLKQTIIEKRLALELATIDNGMEYSKQPNLTSQAELRALEELAMRKQSLIESNLTQELQNIEYQSRMSQTPKPPPPPTKRYYSPPPSPPASAAPHSQKYNTYNTDSSSSVLNNLRNLGILDKKLNIDKRFSGQSSVKTPSNYYNSNDGKYMDHRGRRDDRYAKYPPRQDPRYAAAQEESHGRAHAAWKAAVSKIKKKMKSKSSNNWQE